MDPIDVDTIEPTRIHESDPRQTLTDHVFETAGNLHPVESAVAATDADHESSHMVQQSPLLTANRKGEQDNASVEEKATLRYHRRSLILFFCYLPFLIVPWILTCILAKKPLNWPSYFNQLGQLPADFGEWTLFWSGLVRIFNAIGAVATVPLTSALIAQGAVVYSQRRSTSQKLSLRQTLALADRAWAEVPALYNAYGQDGTGSKYLWLAAGLLILNSIQVPIQQALVRTTTIPVMTCGNKPVEYFGKCAYTQPPLTIGYDPEPCYLALSPQDPIVQSVIKSLASFGEMDVQDHLWHELDTNQGNVDLVQKPLSSSFFWYFKGGQGNSSFFVSALPNATQTGVLREHAMRLNFSVQCNPIDKSDYPTTCGGGKPLITSYSRPTNLSIHICVPGNYSHNPWTPSRDRQNIQEDLYMDISMPALGWEGSLVLNQVPYNLTIHCTANTTRGYFELGNYRNNYMQGSLLDTWPDNETIWNEYNDYLGFDGQVPSTIDDGCDPNLPSWANPLNIFYNEFTPTPGPLMTAALAMFGNESFFYALKTSNTTEDVLLVCQANNIPFSNMGEAVVDFPNIYSACENIDYNEYEGVSTVDGAVSTVLASWFSIFNTTVPSYEIQAAEALTIGMYFATEAWLLETVAASLPFEARPIYSSPGSTVIRPAITVAGITIVSVLIAAQIAGLVALLWYIYTVPTWSTQLNAIAIAQLTRNLPDGAIPPLGPVAKKHFDRLGQIDGIVGIAEEDEAARRSSPSPVGSRNEERDVEAQIGGPGVSDEGESPGADDQIRSSGEDEEEEREEVEEDTTSHHSDPEIVGPTLERGGLGIITKQHAVMSWRSKSKEHQVTEK